MHGGPLLEQVVMLLTRAAGKEMAAALEAQLAVVGERDRRVGAVDLLFEHDVAPGDLAEATLAQILVARLQPRALDMWSPRIFYYYVISFHKQATMTRWLVTDMNLTFAHPAARKLSSRSLLVKRWMCSGLSSGFEGTDTTT